MSKYVLVPSLSVSKAEHTISPRCVSCSVYKLNVLNLLSQFPCVYYINSQSFPLQMRPCHNGGECTITFNDFTCLCPAEYTGKTCETRVWCVSGPCVNGGHCVDLPDGYECKNVCIISEMRLVRNYSYSLSNTSALAFITSY